MQKEKKQKQKLRTQLYKLGKKQSKQRRGTGHKSG
jgi:hypothetical protein